MFFTGSLCEPVVPNLRGIKNNTQKAITANRKQEYTKNKSQIQRRHKMGVQKYRECKIISFFYEKNMFSVLQDKKNLAEGAIERTTFSTEAYDICE